MVKSNGEKDKDAAGSCDLQPLVCLLHVMKKYRYRVACSLENFYGPGWSVDKRVSNCNGW